MALQSLFKRAKGQPSHLPTSHLPSGLRVYAIGDIHGCRDHLRRLHEKIAEDAADAPERRVIIYLGDYVDRGPDCAGVIADLSEPLPPALAALDFERICLKGNHEDWFLKTLETADPAIAGPWLTWGGRETCLSYGVDPAASGDPPNSYKKLQRALLAAVPESHLAFLRSLPVSHSEGGYFFCHAGVRPGVPLARQETEDLIWIREPFLSYREPHGKVVVHGHTPTHEPQALSNRICVDTGACYGGRLTAVALEEDSQRFLQV